MTKFPMSKEYYRHALPESFYAKIVRWVLMLFYRKKQKRQRFAQNKPTTAGAAIPKAFYKTADIQVGSVQQHAVYTLRPRQGASPKVILYLHGGAYVEPILRWHWDLLRQLQAQTGATLVVPDYPLAPRHSYRQTYSMLEQLYAQLLTQYAAENIVFMGDSAGGGLALGLAQQLRDDRQPLPAQLVLLSPWLDVTLTNPAISPELEQADKMLDRESLVLAGKLYAGQDDPKLPLISPIYGNLKNLPKMAIFIGTCDLLYPDCVALKQRLEDEKIPCSYYEYPKMMHDWMVVVGMPEAKDALAKMSAII